MYCTYLPTDRILDCSKHEPLRHPGQVNDIELNYLIHIFLFKEGI